MSTAVKLPRGKRNSGVSPNRGSREIADPLAWGDIDTYKSADDEYRELNPEMYRHTARYGANYAYDEETYGYEG